MARNVKQVMKLEQKFFSEKRSFYKIGSSYSCAMFCKEILQDNASESLLVICLNTKNEIIAYGEIFKGSLNQSIAHPREIFQLALLNNSARILISHNHPSGHPTPSQNDKDFTNRLKESGELIGIELLDHIIVGENQSYFSFREEGIF